MFRFARSPYGRHWSAIQEARDMRRFARCVSGVIVTTAAIWGLSATQIASAQPAPQNCVFDLVQVDPTQTSGDILTVPVEQGCYSTQSQALAAGSSQTSADSPLGASGSVLIGTEFFGLNYSGTSNDYFAASTCSSTVSWSVSY